MHPFVALMRRYCYDYTNRQDFDACDTIMVPEYTLHMGTHELRGRDTQYKPATSKQFQQFPGLCLTINELVTNGERLCLRFAEHGASLRHAGARAAWSGIGLYKWDGTRLTENFVEQDYYSRRTQLADGAALPVETSAIAPWDTEPAAPNVPAEELVRRFLTED
ncbi:MAG: nuclear transport factor 2 family protein, partial [Peristeroidobacter soli]